MSADLFVADTGEADLPVVLCLHSLFIDHTMFDELTAAAAGRFRVVRPDFRGQGANPDAAEQVTMDQCADDILDLLDRLGLERVHVVAQSMGGDVAVRVAARRPEVVDRMVLLGTSAREEPAEHLEAFRPVVDEVARSGFVDELVETTTQIMFGETFRNDPTTPTSSHVGAHTSLPCHRASRTPPVESWNDRARSACCRRSRRRRSSSVAVRTAHGRLRGPPSS
jgi:3-oxoadipate enol-lactonase